MVGREAHLDALRRQPDGTLTGAGQTVLVGGEAGIGKSRLVAEGAAYARGRGMRLLTGTCFEPDRALPYAPVRDLIRSQLFDQPWATPLLVDALPELGELVPELMRFVSNEHVPLPTGVMPDRQRIVHAAVRLFDRIARETPSR